MFYKFNVFRFGGKTVAVFLYVWIWDNFSLLKLPWESPWTWILCFFFQDFMYYLGHRAVHGIVYFIYLNIVKNLEAGFFWGLHTIHHSSEYYNLSTALRQAAIQDLGLAIYDVIQVYFLFFIFFSRKEIFILQALCIPPPIFLIHRYFSEIFQFWMHTSVS